MPFLLGIHDNHRVILEYRLTWSGNLGNEIRTRKIDRPMIMTLGVTVDQSRRRRGGSSHFSSLISPRCECSLEGLHSGGVETTQRTP